MVLPDCLTFGASPAYDASFDALGNLEISPTSVRNVAQVTAPSPGGT